MEMKKRVAALAALGALAVAPMMGPSQPAVAQQDLPSRLLRGAAIAVQGLFLNDAAEARLGAATAQQILSQVPLARDARLQQYVTAVGRQVAAASDRANIPYRFFVLEQKEANAFATPGGYVFVTTGALRLMKNEAQLAGVLGHEVGHVARKHSVAAIRKALVAQGLATAMLDPDSPQLLQMAAGLAANLVLKGYDRRAELEADHVGAAYASKAGYDPRALGDFLDALAAKGGDVPQWLLPVADHPRSDDRRRRLDALIANGTVPVRPGAVTNEARFQGLMAGSLLRPAGGGAGR